MKLHNQISVKTSIIVLSWIFLFPGNIEARAPWLNGQSQGEDLEIILATFGPGDSLETYFGHTGLIVRDRRLGDERLYNYGMFSFEDGMLLQFIRGRLWFWVAETHVEASFEWYRSLNRDIRLQKFNLSPEKKLAMARQLATDVLPENRFYLYHHYDDNCSTRIRDIINDSVDGQFKEYATSTGRFNLREHTIRYGYHDTFMAFLMMVGLNGSVDRPITTWEEMFLPVELEKAIDNFQYFPEGNPAAEAVPYISERRVIYSARNRSAVPSYVPSISGKIFIRSMILAVLILLPGFLIYQKSRAAKNQLTPEAIRASLLFRTAKILRNSVIALFIIVPSFLLLFIWFFTDHTVAYRNWNLLLANPLTVMLFFLKGKLMYGRLQKLEILEKYLPQLMIKRVGLSFLLFAMAVLALVLQLLPYPKQDLSVALVFYLPLLLALFVSEYLLAADSNAVLSPSSEQHSDRRNKKKETKKENKKKRKGK